MKQRLTRSLFLIFLLFLISGCAATTGQLYYAAPTQFSATQRQMKTAGFWITQQPSPNQVIMTDDEIVQFNQHVREDLKLTKDIFNLSDLSGPGLVKEWNESIKK